MLPGVKPSQHGALDFAELERLGIHPDEVLDFSVNSNPFGTSPLVREAILSTSLERYPDRESLALRRALSIRLNVPTEEIIVGNGTAELIQLAAFAFLNQGDNVLILGPTFGEYERSARLVGANIHSWQAHSETGFAIQSKEIQQKMRVPQYRLVFLCNPNNPTGQVLSLNDLNEWAEHYPETLFVVDEAYLAFVPGMRSAISLRRKNILVLHSMTKDHAIAGLRLGYTVGDVKLIGKLENVRPAWNVNALAQAAGLAVLQDEKYLSRTLTKLHVEKENLVQGLKDLGYFPVPSRTNYFLLPIGNGAQFRRNLLRHGILVRDCASFGLIEYVRIAARTRVENLRLLNTLADLRSLL